MTELTEEAIREDERRRICRREGHNESETTTWGAPEREFQCARCRARRTEPYPVYCTCEYIEYSTHEGRTMRKHGLRDPNCKVHKEKS